MTTADAPNASHPPSRRHGRVFVLLCGVGVVALIVSILLPSSNRRREEKLARLAQRQCPSTLGRIGMTLMLYQNANGGAVPRDLDALQRFAQADYGADTWRLFTCPYAHERGVIPTHHGAVCASSYIYVVPPGVSLYSQIANPGEAVCAYEPLENHDGLGTPVLFWDGHSTWYDAPEAKRIIEAVNAGRNPPPRPATR